MPLLYNLGLLFLLVGVGWWARRRAWLQEPAVRALGRICVDVAFPCLSFTQMLGIIGRQSLGEQGRVLLLGAVLLPVAIATGWGMSRRLPPAIRSTAWLAIAVPNWIFLPLPIAAMLYGPLGVSTILLINVVSQFFLWTVCVGILRGFGRQADWRALLSPGLLATAAGAGLAALWPPSRDWLSADGWLPRAAQALAKIGLLTIPLSMLVLGAQLGAARPARRGAGVTRAILAGRLLLAPLLTALALLGLRHFWALPPEIWRVAVLIAAMPVAVSCGVLVERYGGDRDAMSDAILLSTALSVLTVPPFVLLAERLFR